jgi:exodeoxyribonuclease VII small subunit
MAKKEAKELGFDEALQRLEEIVAQMESGEMDLDAMVASFEEGQRLVKFCSQKLNEVERRIELLVKDSTGADGTAPFAPPVAVPGE